MINHFFGVKQQLNAKCLVINETANDSIYGISLNLQAPESISGFYLCLLVDGLVQKICNSSVLAMELCLSCINPSM